MIEKILSSAFIQAYELLYQKNPAVKFVIFQKTRPEFEGDYTLVVFPFTKELKKSPEQIATEIGQQMVSSTAVLSSFNVIKGFLNLVIDDIYWMEFFKKEAANESFGLLKKEDPQKVVIEYSSPNTNKPLHLGHIRNNLLGWSVAEIMKAAGNEVYKVNLVNDRGIHICKSMLAWQKWGEGKTPAKTKLKGDKLVGDMYVRFDVELKKQVEKLQTEGLAKDDAIAVAPLTKEAREMLFQWEAGNQDVRLLWETMNNWVYEGFSSTYNRLGIDFDKIYYESETYLLGKELVFEGLEKGVFYQKDDGSVWCDLSEDGLDEKLLLRADGTSVYMTQDIGTANLRYEDYKSDKMIYVVGNEQNYHFDVLQKVLAKLGKPWAESIEHLSYGMVELPEGKMKSREGKVVDADDLMDEVIATARRMTVELGKLENMESEEANNLFRIIGLGALKYFMLKVDPKKTMLFNPAESVDFTGNTGPFIQYTHARIKSVLRKAADNNILLDTEIALPKALLNKEKSLLVLLYTFPAMVEQAAENRSPALIANYMYDLAKEFNQFYQECPIIRETDEAQRLFRLQLSAFAAKTIHKAAALLGIEMPERM
ncbi:MAG: arginine--tRNA ligase [Bacteroidetes bacterium]|nr:arginine--tRNA ligase [Bacteroidota bacterium]MBU1578706.1 arginine--tRNA ligase [Bacteroidota bacterium]MBU2465794.1 arginine--tRNA ligase [Bacteroidota bacterium]MBU2556875.1 arginine--tRNA ligase [Bacteroidota bacterium]